MPRDVGYTTGKGLGSFLSAFFGGKLEAKEKKKDAAEKSKLEELLTDYYTPDLIQPPQDKAAMAMQGVAVPKPDIPRMPYVPPTPKTAEEIIEERKRAIVEGEAEVLSNEDFMVKYGGLKREKGGAQATRKLEDGTTIKGTVEEVLGSGFNPSTAESATAEPKGKMSEKQLYDSYVNMMKALTGTDNLGDFNLADTTTADELMGIALRRAGGGDVAGSPQSSATQGDQWTSEFARYKSYEEFKKDFDAAVKAANGEPDPDYLAAAKAYFGVK